MQLDLVGGFREQQWLPDETVFSWAARYHRLSGHWRSSLTAKLLFGGRFSGFLNDVPAGLRHLAAATGGALGSAEEILDTHSILPFLLLFSLPSRRQEIVDMVLADQSAAAKSILGLRRVGLESNLKACLGCIAVDEATTGFAYWHLEHQLPGVWFCRQHRELLCVAPQPARYEWILPSRQRLDALQIGRDHKLVLLAETSCAALSEASRLRIDERATAQIYLEELIRRRWLERGRKYSERAAAELQNFGLSLGAVPEIRHQVSKSGWANRWIKLLCACRLPTKTINHVILIVWLFGGWNAFRANVPMAS